MAKARAKTTWFPRAKAQFPNYPSSARDLQQVPSTSAFSGTITVEKLTAGAA
jgi:hypothetical protein